MPVADLTGWLEEQSLQERVWIAKRLSANDTGLTGSHQAGVYLPKPFLFAIIPAMPKSFEKNPKHEIEARIASHPHAATVCATWYRQKTRNEVRLTSWGGASSAVQDVENTGSLALFSFALDSHKNAQTLDVWVSGNSQEEDAIEGFVGPVEPGEFVTRYSGTDQELKSALLRINLSPTDGDCSLKQDEISDDWLKRFPDPHELVDLSISKRRLGSKPVDARLIKRRECEFQIFKSIETYALTPQITGGFETVGDFLSLAHSTLQRRKARSGRSLEIQLERLFVEEGFLSGKTFDVQKNTENRSKPDFLFPSQAAYGDDSFPRGRLRMLAVKTTAKDRWRQILSEAERIAEKHLLTLQEGISENQYKEMKKHKVRLVVPTPLLKHYPSSFRDELLSLEDFMGEVCSLGDKT